MEKVKFIIIIIVLVIGVSLCILAYDKPSLVTIQ